MELTLPSVWNVSIEVVVTLMMFFIVASWFAASAYRRVMEAIAMLNNKIEAIGVRNEHADRETADLSRRQQASETAQAVVASEMKTVLAATKRIDGNIQTLIGRDKNGS